MGEYAWPVKQIWFGVEGPKPELPMLGIIKRSGRCRQTGHFCYVKIPVNGNKVWAGGAEARTFYMHLVSWEDIGKKIPRDMIPALGWTKDGNTYCFWHESQVVKAGSKGTLCPVHPEKWGDWKENLWTLIQKGAHVMSGRYIALMDTRLTEKGWGVPRRERPLVTLPPNSFVRGRFAGLEGPLFMWNGKPPSWCVQVVEVNCPDGWIHVRKEHVKVLWEKPNA